MLRFWGENTRVWMRGPGVQTPGFSCRVLACNHQGLDVGSTASSTVALGVWVGAGGALLPQIFLISRNQLAHCSTSCSPLLRSEVLEPFLAKPVTVSL